jgi:hypothetical protein
MFWILKHDLCHILLNALISYFRLWPGWWMSYKEWPSSLQFCTAVSRFWLIRATSQPIMIMIGLSSIQAWFWVLTVTIISVWPSHQSLIYENYDGIKERRLYAVQLMPFYTVMWWSVTVDGVWIGNWVYWTV